MKKVFSAKFKKAYLVMLAVLSALIVCWLVFVWVNLNIYEKSNPGNVASSVFNQYFRELDFDKLFAMERSSFSELETLDNYTAYLKQRAGTGSRNFISVPLSEDTEGVKKYVVFTESAGFAEFELKEKAGVFGKVWELSSVRTVFDKINAFNIVVPSGSSVHVNGRHVSANYKTGDKIFCEMAGVHDIYTISGLAARPVVEASSGGRMRALSYDSEFNEYSAIPVLTADIIDSFSLFINGIKVEDSFILRDGIRTDETNRLRLHRKIYRVPYGLGGQPDVSIVSITGKESAIIDDGNLNFVQKIVSDADLERQYKDLAIAAAKTYAEFMTYDTGIRELQRYFQTGTQIYNNIRTSEVYFYTPHIDYWFENINASEFLARENDTFSCRVTFSHYVRRNAQQLNLFPLDVTLFFRRSGAQYLIYDMIINS